MVDADNKLSLFIIVYLNGDPALTSTILRKGQILFHRFFMGKCNNYEYFEKNIQSVTWMLIDIVN